MKQNSSRKIKERFEWLNQVNKPEVIWFPGYLFSSVELNERHIEIYVQYQENLQN